MTAPRSLASVSLDLDDLWAYLKVQGNPSWRDRPSYLRAFLPRVLDLLDTLGLRITFFIVGADAARAEHRDLMQEITRRGHEVGNHSYEHESWLHTYALAELTEEITRAEDAIADATGQRPVAFRGPGYSWSVPLLELLARRGYRFDASTLPTYIGPLARWYYFRSAKLSAEERHTRRLLFGKFSDGFRPVHAHRMRLPSGATMLEIPVTTLPLVRTPFHPSYLLYLSRFSVPTMRAYLRTGLALCELRGVEPSILLHPLDLLGADDVDALEFFPGMDLSGARKRELIGEVMSTITTRFRAVPMGEHATALAARPLPERLVTEAR